MNQRTLTSLRDGLRDWLFGALVLALLTLAAATLGPTTTRAIPEPAPSLSPAPAPSNTCWITGDVGGEANPAVIHASFCHT